MSNEDYGVSDSDHVEMAFGALSATLDRINGMEGFAPEPSQIYVYSILEADGGLSREERVAGNESFFGAIGNGLQAVWDFIAKIFKGIWNFFFGSSDDAIAKKEATAVSQVNGNIEQQSKLHKEIDEFNAKQKAMNKADDAERAKENDAKNAKYDAETKAWKAMVNKRREEQNEFVARAERISQKLTSWADPAEEGTYKDTIFAQLHDQMYVILGNMEHVARDSALKKAGKINDIMTALSSQHDILHYLGKLKDSRVPLDRIKNQLSSAIKDLETRVKATKKDDPKFAKLKKDLNAGKDFMVAMTHINKFLEATIDDCVKFSNWLKNNYNVL